jgi:hypothetical protein
MAKTDFKPVMIRQVEFKYPRLSETYRYNTAEKRSEPCPPTASNAAFSIAWEMTHDAARSLHAELKAHYESCQTKAPFAKVFGIRSWRTATSSSRQSATAPTAKVSLTTSQR